MLKVAPLRNLLGAEGPLLFWLIPFAVLMALATVSLLSLGPMTVSATLIGLLIILMVRYHRVALIAFPLCLAAMFSLMWLAADQHQRNIRYGIFGEVYYASGYYTELAPFLNVTYAGAPFESYISVSPNIAAVINPKGHILIRSPRFERSSSDGHMSLRCDARCRLLLSFSAVKSVTLQVEPDVWNQGPRALMAFNRPESRRFELRSQEHCGDLFSGQSAGLPTLWTIQSAREAVVRGKNCLQSSAAQDDFVYDAIVDDSAFEL